MWFKRTELTSAKPQLACASMKHNTSVIKLPDARTRADAKVVIFASNSLNDKQKLFLFWALDQSDTWTLSVEDFKRKMCWGEKKWRSVRDSLAAMGVYTQTRHSLPSRASRWDMVIDVRSLFLDTQQKGEDHARALDPSDWGGITRNPSPVERMNLKVFTPPPPPARVAGEVRPGLVEAEKINKLGSERLPPCPLYPCLPPLGGGGVKCPESLQDAPGFFGREHFSKFKTDDFFNWWGRNGIPQVFIEGQPRKKTPTEILDGNGSLVGIKFDRGAPVARFFGFQNAVLTSHATEEIVELGRRLESRGKVRVDLQVQAEEDEHGKSRSLLIDDLTREGVNLVKSRWNGPGAIIETSQSNFQAVLILSTGMSREARKSIVRQLNSELGGKGPSGLGGDPAAVSPVQLHRFPGSPNFKFVNPPEPFICRLVEYFKGSGLGVQPKVSAVVSCWQGRTSGKVTLSPGSAAVGQSDNSKAAFARCCKLLKAGISDSSILEELGTRWLTHHDPKDWPRRTLHAAKQRIC